MKSPAIIFGQAPLFRNQKVLIFWKVTALLLASQKRVENFSQKSSEVSVLGVTRTNSICHCLRTQQ
jgi:hypothetical protein